MLRSILGRRIALAFGATFLLLIALTAATFVNVRRLIEAAALVDHTKDVIGQLDTILSVMKDAETGQRGYLLTGNPTYLEQHLRSISEISARMVRVHELTRDNPAQERRARRLEDLTGSLLHELDETIGLRREQGLAAALVQINTGIAKTKMDAIRAVVLEMESQEKELLAERSIRSRQSARFTLASLAVGAVFLYGFLFLSLAIVRYDLIQRRQSQQEQARLYEEARAALQVRDDFLSTASHDLRTPLTSISLLTQSLLRQARRDGNEKVAEGLDKIQRQVGRLTRLTEELLDVVRIRGGRLALERQEVNLGALVLRTADRLREVAEQSDCSIAVTESEKVDGFWDESRLDQVVTNLLSNAIKFGARQPIEVTLEKRGDKARLSVSDRGPGIAPKDRQRIFERFERIASGRQPGLGLGLWIAHRIVLAHDGEIGVEDIEPRGSRFWIELPLGAPEATSSQPRAATARGSETIPRSAFEADG